jgi:hypothetical protein
LYGYYQEGKFKEDVILVRIYGQGTELMIDRDVEKQNIQVNFGAFSIKDTFGNLWLS